MLIFGNRSKKPDGFEFNTFSWKLRQRFEGMKKKNPNRFNQRTQRTVLEMHLTLLHVTL